MLSSLQLCYGFPLLKKPSSVLSHYNDVANIGSKIYFNIPFALEIRSIIDFTFKKTTLDVFQMCQLYVYHHYIYGAKIGNRSYDRKVLGIATPKCEKIIFGVLITLLLWLMIVGPFIMFSDFGSFVDQNPVLSTQM